MSCILNCDSPSYGPTLPEYVQCYCVDCQRSLREVFNYTDTEIAWARFRLTHTHLYERKLWATWPFAERMRRVA